MTARELITAFGRYTITGEGPRGSISWTMSDIAVGEYNIKGEEFIGIYTNELGVRYTTVPQGGLMIVYVDNSGGTISGSFRMRVYNGPREINFFRAEFQNISVGAPDPVDDETGD